MSLDIAADIGDDPAISPSFGAPDVGLDPTIALPPDPFSNPTVPVDPSGYTAPVYGPSLSQLGLTPQSAPAVGDPNAFSSNPTTAKPSGTSIWDEVLGVAKIGLAAGQIATGQASTNVQSPAKTQSKVATAKLAGGSGTGLGTLGILIVIFVAIFVWLEVKH